MPLKLTIKKGETMLIGDNIEVFCTSTTDKQASFRINAPRSVEITRLMADGTAPTRNSERGQSLSPEQQRNLALNKLNRGK
jgi:sRNA-binding carbon storage regulator CsrA